MKQNIKTLIRRSAFVLCGVGILGLAANPASAQVPGSQCDKPGYAMKAKEPKTPKWQKLQPVLGLTDEQIAEMEIIKEQQREKARQVRENQSLTPEQKREEIRKLREQGKAEMDSILTAEQRQKLQEMRERKQERMRERAGQCTGANSQPAAKPDL